MIIPPTLFTAPYRRRGRGAGGPPSRDSGWEALLFFAAFALPLACLFGYMWYDLEYNMKPAEAKARQEAAAALQKWKDDCIAGGNVLQDWTERRSRYYKGRTTYYNVMVTHCVKP